MHTHETTPAALKAKIEDIRSLKIQALKANQFTEAAGYKEQELELAQQLETQEVRTIEQQAKDQTNAKMIRESGGRLTILPPLHESDHMSNRHFDGNKHKHCTRCSHPDGCVMCCLP